MVTKNDWKNMLVMEKFFTIAFDCCMIGMIIIPLITAIIGLFDNKKEYTEIDYFIHRKNDN